LARRVARARIDRLKKRIVALVFLATVLALVAATLLVLRTPWAGDRICAFAASRASAASGLPISFGACRVEPLNLELQVEDVRLGPPAAPVFAAEHVGARLAAVQALGGRVRIARLDLVRPRVKVAVPRTTGGGPSICGPDLLARLEIRELQISDGSLEVAFAGGQSISARRLDVQAYPAVRSMLALRPRTRLEVEVGDLKIAGLDDRPITTPRLAVTGEVAADLSVAEITRAEAVVDGVQAVGRGRIKDLCAPVFDLDVTASGPGREVLALARVHPDAPAAGTVRAEGRIAGPVRRPTITASLRVEHGRVGWFHPGDLRAEARLTPELDGLVVDRLEWPVGAGTIRGKGKVSWRGPVSLEWEVDTGGPDLAELLEVVGIEGSWVTVRLDGKGRVAGTVYPTLALTGAYAGDFRDLRTYTRSWRTVKPGTQPVGEVRRGKIDVPFRVGPEGITYEGAKVSAGRATSVVDAVSRFSYEGGFQVRWRGGIDLDLVGKVAGVPVGGLAEFEASLGAAPYGNPRATGHARAEGFRFMDVALGTGSADFDYGPDFVVRVRGAEGLFKQTRWRGEGSVDLEPSPVFVRRMQLEAKGPMKDLFDAVQDWLPSTRKFRNVFDGEVEVAGTGSGPAGLIDGTFEASMGSGTFLGRAFDSARTSGTYHRSDEARFDRAELRRGAGAVRMTGRYGFSPPYPWDLDVSFAGLSLRDAGLPSAADWAGSASGTVALRGSFEHPDVRVAANGDGVSFRGVPLGSLQAAGTVKEEQLVLTGGADGLRFEAEARLDGRMPFRARADLALEDVARFVPGGAPAALKAKVKGEATAEGELVALELARARVRLDEVQAGHAEFRVHAAAPVVLTASRGRVEVQALTLVGPNTELTVSGARAASGQLDLTAAGTADLRLLAGLVPDLRRPHGQLQVEAHVTGTVEEPVLVGAGRLADAGFQLKTTSILFSEVGGALAFSQNRVLFEDLTAGVNGGRARLRGEIELASFVPVRGRVEAQIDEVPVAVPAYLPATLSGRIEAAGTPDATAVTGRLHVVRARYTADVGLERNLLELRRRAPPPPKPYDKSQEWVRFDLQIVVDGDVRVENDLVSGPVRGELTLTGTLAAPGVVGRLTMGDGSRARFRGNEFVLTRAVLDFTDRTKLDVSLDVHGESQVRDYQVFMHGFGKIADPQLTLTSVPPLTQPDIITLLSLGFTRRDAAATAGVGGAATAAAAQALFSASGLDEQVRRFVPRSQMVRDLNVRITTDYSEFSGQIEPRAELESLLLGDRLRLRLQTSLTGSGSGTRTSGGQKAQAEVRLGRRASIQYQWDNDNPEVISGDHGVDLKLRWEWTE
jgi:translocation and assembly module TamB